MRQVKGNKGSAGGDRMTSFTAGPGIKRTIAPKSLERFKQRIREITRKAKGVSIKTTMEELATICGAGATILASAKRPRC